MMVNNKVSLHPPSVNLWYYNINYDKINAQTIEEE